MYPIYIYLLKDIANIVLDYVYKSDIKKLNIEYCNKIQSKKFKFSKYREYYIFKNIMLNYRFLPNIPYNNRIYNNSHIDICFYSSGYNDLNRFE